VERVDGLEDGEKRWLRIIATVTMEKSSDPRLVTVA
jgi:hypothetical protein